MISNNCFSGNALKGLFDRLLPGNRFEFVLASSDYLFRKPDGIMFEIGLRKAKLTAQILLRVRTKDYRLSMNTCIFTIGGS